MRIDDILSHERTYFVVALRAATPEDFATIRKRSLYSVAQHVLTVFGRVRKTHGFDMPSWEKAAQDISAELADLTVHVEQIRSTGITSARLDFYKRPPFQHNQYVVLTSALPME